MCRSSLVASDICRLVAGANPSTLQHRQDVFKHTSLHAGVEMMLQPLWCILQVAKSPVAPIVAYSYAISRRGIDLTSGEPQAGTKGGSSLVLAVSNQMF